MSRCHVHDGDVDIGCQLLLCSFAQAAFLQRIAQFECVQNERDGLLEAERRRDGKLRVVAEIARLIHAIVGLSDVGLGAVDHVVGALHHRAVGVVDGHVTGKHQRVVEAFEDVLERYALFLTK